MIGRTIGKYRVVGQLGRGGAGLVYQAVDETLNRDVAIKILNPDFANSEVMQRFRAEATILAKLNHPHIATIYELFRSETDLLMVMELVRGETLDKLSERLGPMPPSRAAGLVDQILSALEHSHRAGIVHRDMKPANVMVTEAGTVKIMDFGIARVRGADQMTVDRLMGTPAYMPPEQVLGEELDGRADLYSVGVLLYRLLTGALPFTADTALGMLQRQIKETPTPMSLHRAGLPEWCEPIVQRALAKPPADRFQSAEEFRDALGRATGVVPADLAKTRSIPGSDGNTLDLSLDQATIAPTPAAVANAASANRKRFALAFSMVAMVAIGAAVLAYRSPWPDTTAPPIEAIVLPPAVTEPITPATEPSRRNGSSDPSLAVPSRRDGSSDPSMAAEPVPAAAPPPATNDDQVVPAPASAPQSPPTRRIKRTTDRPLEQPAVKAPEPSLVFETKALVGAKKPREQNAQLVLGNGRITVTAAVGEEDPLYSIPYDGVISISYSRGRDPMWNSPLGPAPVARGGGTLGRLGIIVSRDWISLRTNTKDQFVALRFEEVKARLVLLALEERTGRVAELVAAPKDD